MNDDDQKRIHEEIAKAAALDRLRKETQAKRIILDSKRIDLEMSKVKQAEQDMKQARETNFGEMSEQSVKELQQQNAEYIMAARKANVFINNTFNGVVPFFRKNLIVIGGRTGEGKSTAVANIVWTTIQQKNATTGKWCKVLVISNEEDPADVYNRITCHAKGWHYVNHDKFTDEQLKTFNDMLPVWTKDGRLRVIGNNDGGAGGVTTSVEGIQTIFENLLKNQEYYDVVILDYFQNVKESKKDPRLDEWKVQAQLAAALDHYKNLYPAPIVVMAQLNPSDKDDKKSFEGRLQGRKSITTPATLVMEMVAERDRLRTKWIVHKSRFTGAVGACFYTGYDHGKFVEYTPEFQRQVNIVMERREWAQNVGTDIFKEKKDE